MRNFATGSLSTHLALQNGLADVISIHESLTNQILLFHSETVATAWLQYDTGTVAD